MKKTNDILVINTKQMFEKENRKQLKHYDNMSVQDLEYCLLFENPSKLEISYIKKLLKLKSI
jgi:hypothetical protein